MQFSLSELSIKPCNPPLGYPHFPGGSRQAQNIYNIKELLPVCELPRRKLSKCSSHNPPPINNPASWLDISVPLISAVPYPRINDSFLKFYPYKDRNEFHYHGAAENYKEYWESKDTVTSLRELHIRSCDAITLLKKKKKQCRSLYLEYGLPSALWDSTQTNHNVKNHLEQFVEFHLKKQQQKIQSSPKEDISFHPETFKKIKENSFIYDQVAPNIKKHIQSVLKQQPLLRTQQASLLKQPLTTVPERKTIGSMTITQPIESSKKLIQRRSSLVSLSTSTDTINSFSNNQHQQQSLKKQNILPKTTNKTMNQEHKMTLSQINNKQTNQSNPLKPQRSLSRTESETDSSSTSS